MKGVIIKQRRFDLKDFLYRLKMTNWTAEIRRLYYAAVHGIYCGTWKGSLLPVLGRGKYVDVIQRGSFIDIHDHGTNETIRLVPCQYNHGVMVERLLPNGNMSGRMHLSFDMFRRFMIDSCEIGR